MSDQDIVNKILKGDENALEYFYHKNKSRLFLFIKTKVTNEKDAEELLTDIFLSTIDNLDHFQGKCALFSFLCSVASHKIIDYYRKRKIKCIFFSENPYLEKIISKISLPEEELEKKLLSLKINKIFSVIAPKYKQILIQKYIEGFSIKEIALKSQMNIKQTESLLFRARKVFQSQFATLEIYG
jgi:RNA polymerase sigma-70 factor, ECF subfamily